MQYINHFLSTLPCNWLNLALTCRKENVNDIAAISTQLERQYYLYDGIITNRTTPLPPTAFNLHRALLIDYYENAPAALKRELLRRRNEHELYFCPFCGNPKKPDTLDHFIPKDEWPEYSIFPNNLVPQCRACAPIKGEHYYSQEDMSAKFAHPFYSNTLNKYRFKITTEFNTENNTASFSVRLVKKENTTLLEDSIILLHLKNLKAPSRIIKYSNDKFRRWKSKLTKYNFDLRAAINQRLGEIPPDDVGKDWDSAFISGLLMNDDAIEYLHSLRPPTLSPRTFHREEELELEIQ